MIEIIGTVPVGVGSEPLKVIAVSGMNHSGFTTLKNLITYIFVFAHLDDGRFGQCADISQVGLIVGNLLQNSPHDLPRPDTHMF